MTGPDGKTTLLTVEHETVSYIAGPLLVAEQMIGDGYDEVVGVGVVLAFSVGFAVGSLTGLSLALVVLWSGRGRTVIGLVEEERFGIDADSEREHPEHS